MREYSELVLLLDCQCQLISSIVNFNDVLIITQTIERNSHLIGWRRRQTLLIPFQPLLPASLWFINSDGLTVFVVNEDFNIESPKENFDALKWSYRILFKKWICDIPNHAAKTGITLIFIIVVTFVLLGFGCFQNGLAQSLSWESFFIQLLW